MQQEIVNIVGGGYAGTEAALTLAKYGVKVHLFDLKSDESEPPIFLNENSQVLKNELLALQTSLAPYLKNGERIKQNFDEIWQKTENLCVFHKKITEIALSEPTIIATGPNTDPAFFAQLDKVLGPAKCHSSQPQLPIVAGIEDKLTKRGENYYFPLSKQKTEELCQAINYFRSDSQKNSVEKWARAGRETLRAKALRPVVSDQVEYACIKFEKVEEGFLMTDFRSSLPQNAQNSIFKFLFGEGCQIKRYATETPCTFVDPSLTINEHLQCKMRPNIFFAGRIIKAEGPLVAIATGHLCALNMLSFLKRRKYVSYPKNTCVSALIDKLFSKGPFNLTQICLSCDIIKQTDEKQAVKALQKFKEDFDARNAWHNNMCSKKGW